ncbi:unnamed protein product [Ectocarpus sp. 13 AM-2016]
MRVRMYSTRVSRGSRVEGVATPFLAYFNRTPLSSALRRHKTSKYVGSSCTFVQKHQRQTPHWRRQVQELLLLSSHAYVGRCTFRFVTIGHSRCEQPVRVLRSCFKLAHTRL